ncbi:MAG TPA: hypothetical protein VKM72_01400 [Thermoanaerobaculia bacterium]|nr:hypothetical protein [Thermoanaerobaculia bacterium]
MPEKKGREPRLTAQNARFRSGYAPRTIRLARDRSALFVGCKDGSVTMIDLAAAADPERADEARIRLCGARETGVRSLCDLDNGWLLLGQDNGTLATLPWKGVAPENGGLVPSPVLLPHLPQDAGAFGYVGRWERKTRTFVVSPRRAEAFLLHLEEDPASKEFTLVAGQGFPGVTAMSGFARLGEQERWIVGKTGALWWQGPEGFERLDDLWGNSGFERPGFVFDLAVVRTNPDRWPDHGIYLSTDEGVFLLRRPWSGDPPGEPGKPPRFGLEPVYLPGITDTCMAITHAVQGDHCFLWVSDIDGSVHLFWSDAKFWDPGESGRRSRWRRSGLLERRFPVMRALASWAPERPHEAMVCQACRDDRIVISWYLSQGAAEAVERMDAAELLSWGDIKQLRGLLPADDSRTTWCSEALVADHIEETGAEPERLWRFLRNPGIELAGSVLREILATDPAERAVERAGQALTLWTHTLIGTVHRRLESPGMQDYLGIIRWLRRIGESAQELTGDNQEQAEELRQGIDRNIQYARKWGVFGRTYRDRESLHSAIEPLQRQSEEERRFDRLVYESLLFRRRVDPVETLPSPASYAFAPWDLCHLAVEEKGGDKRVEHVAVSWADGGTVYRRRGAGEPWEDLTAGRSGPERAPLGGRILLGTAERGGKQGAFLLSSPAPEEERSRRRQGGQAGKPAEIQLRFLSSTDPLPRKPADALTVEELVVREDRGRPGSREIDPARPEAVYCLHALGAGRVAVGLEGTSGAARIGLLEVTPRGDLRSLRPRRSTALPTNYPESKTLLRNPVWSLASYGVSAEKAILFMGCGDGQIWKLHIRFSGSTFEIAPYLVGRLGAPVSALGCRADETRDHGLLRVFAGGADGTLVAFQRAWKDEKEIYTTLWATREQGPVRSLHIHQSPLVVGEQPEQDEAGSQNLVLAVTQPGMAVLLLDRPGVESRRPGSVRRLRVPGERLGRFFLDSAVFGSALPSEDPRGASPVLARLLVAPATGGPRLLTLHHPKFTPSRRSEFRELRRRWLESLHGTGDRVQGYLLRRPETTYAASPELPAVLVRWIFPFEPREEKSWEERSLVEGPGPGPPRQWLPRHLRPLADLDAAWKRGAPLHGLLRDALLAAREVKDKFLFKEILEAVLSRANHQIHYEALSGRGLPFAKSFEDLLADLERVKGAWEGSSGRPDSRMRITIVKNLLDGDTLWSLSQVPREPRESRAAGSLEPADAVLAASVRLLHRSLGKGDLLLALETLRAANLALLRLCLLLQRRWKDGKEDWSQIEMGRHCVSWESLRGFYRAVGDFAARVAHPKGNLGEVAAHEVCRAYALGMIACPLAVAELAFWIAEADLPADTSQQVVQQLDLLETVLGDQLPPLSPYFRSLLGIAFGLPGGSYKEALFFLPPPEDRPWVTSEACIGRGNVKVVQERKPFDDIVVWLHKLAQQLSNDAGNVALRKHESLYTAIEAAPDTKDYLRHSRQFWKKALEELREECDRCLDLFAEPEAAESTEGNSREMDSDGVPLRPVRPELVLFSGTLQSWCKAQRSELQRLRGKYQIFEPASSLYDEALALVERAARRFGHGAAVQKNLVLGVLGHGLLELLDEHLLEVWEVAQALDPRRTWEQDDLEGENGNRGSRDTQRPATTTAGRFADYLLQRALKAEAIPKNLRSLQGLLSFTGEGSSPELTLRSLIEKDVESWEVDLETLPRAPLDRRTYHFLHLTLNELLQNDRMHGIPGTKPTIQVEPSPPGKPALCFEFRYPADDPKARERARELADLRLQTMMPPREEPRLPSHGTGLYLANLAAGAVGWKLEPEAPRAGVLRFKLLRKMEEE